MIAMVGSQEDAERSVWIGSVLALRKIASHERETAENGEQ